MTILRPFGLSILAVILLLSPTFAAELSYQLPPKALMDLVDAPSTPSVNLSPDRSTLLITERHSLLSIEILSQDELRLAGLRIDPKSKGPSRQRPYHRVAFKSINGGKSRKVEGLPESYQLTNLKWSPDSKKVAGVLNLEDRLELWIIEAESGKAMRADCPPLNAALGTPYHWLPGSDALVARCILTDAGNAPSGKNIPRGPVVQENLGGKRPARTHQDMLTSPVDEAIFTFYTLSRLHHVDLNKGTKVLGKPDLITSFLPSPDGSRLLVDRLRKPFSYSLPYYRFPKVTEVWDLEGRVLAEIEDLPLADKVPMAFGSVREGRRSIAWRADSDATLYTVEALDGGNAGLEAEYRDAVYLLAPPYQGEGQLLAKLSLRFSKITWGKGDLALLEEMWWKSRQMKSWRLSPDIEGFEPILLWDRSREDRYNDPGRPLMQRDSRGQNLLFVEDDSDILYLLGSGASDEGDRPFLDRWNLENGKKDRLFRSQSPWYERVVAVLDANKLSILTQRESISEPPNYYIRDLKRDRLKAITDFPHPTPELATVSKELIRYEREDGVQLSGTLYLPPGYDADRDGALPLLLWAYPREFKNAAAASQVKGSPYRFVRLGWYSPLVHLLEGFAVLDGPSMPIVGEGDAEPNDTFVEQLVASAQAAIDEVARRGVGDPDRVAVGGHSYGAFMAANLLAHSDLFKAAIARSGAYNRTLTPFGFQAEERSLWQAPEIYFAMSPFMHAEKIDEPILLIHGESDNNAGTYPLQSERLYGALKGHGGTARLVMLTHESHSYRARESVMHMLWEQSEWLDRYVKNSPVKGSASR